MNHSAHSAPMACRRTVVTPRRPAGRPYGRRAFTLIELLVVVGIIALLIGILIPVIGGAKLSAATAKCLANSRSLGQANMTYANDHELYFPPDMRVPYEERNAGTIRNLLAPAPVTEAEMLVTWFGPLWEGDYVSRDHDALDCPVIDDHRKTTTVNDRGIEVSYWWTDYVLNRYAIYQRPESVSEPSRGPLIVEPDGAFATVTPIEHCIAKKNWFGADGKDRMDLEQRKVGSLAFTFVDGSSKRVQIDPEEPYPADETAAQMFPDIFFPSLMAPNYKGEHVAELKFFLREVGPSDAAYVNAGPPTRPAPR